MPLPITVYGATDCDDTERTCAHLRTRQIPFREVNIDLNPDAERFVILVNDGFRSTPTLILGEGNLKIILTEPTNAELDQLDQALARLGDNLFSYLRRPST